MRTVPIRTLQTLACILTASCLLLAQKHAPLPNKLIDAQKAYLINDSGDLKAFDRLFSELKKWGRLTIVTSRSDANVVIVMSSRDDGGFAVATGSVVSTGSVATGTGTSVFVPNTYVHLTVIDAATNEQLWHDSTAKRLSSGGAPSKLVSNLKKRLAESSPVPK